MKHAALLIVILTAAFLSGCGTSAAFKSDCDWTTLIRPSKDDRLTRKTKEMILAHNEIVRRECGVR